MKVREHFPGLEINIHSENTRRFDPAIKTGVKMRKPPKKPTARDRETVLGPVRDPSLNYDKETGTYRGNPLYSGATK